MSASMEHAFAVVESVETDGLRLKFDGEDAAGEKLYKCNTFFKFAAGDRVYCVKDSGTFVAICKIGAPAAEIVADKATEAETAKTAESAGTAESVETAESADTAKMLLDYADDFYRVAFREATSYGILEYAHPYNGQTGSYTWFPLGSPIDESVTYPGSTAIVRFRSTSAGKLQFMIPYRNSYTWYTVATEQNV